MSAPPRDIHADRTPPAAGVVRFGAFEADLGSEELRKNGVLIHLPAQPFRILTLLVEHRGEIVTRERLRQALWATDTYVDFDRCLNTAMNRLREALGDSAEHPRYVQTVPKQGYRFLAPVEFLPVAPADNGAGEGGATAAPGEETAPSAGPAKARWRWVALTAVLAAGFLILAASWWFHAPPRRETGAGLPVAAALTDYPGSEIAPAYAPDASAVAYSWKARGRDDHDIYVQSAGGSAGLRLTDSPAEDYAPAYSPDGRRIAFYRRSGDMAGIYVSAADGRSVERLAGLRIGPPAPASGDDPVGFDSALAALSWSPDGKFLAYVDKVSPEQGYSIFLRGLESRENERVTWPAAGSPGDGFPAFSPDGRLLAFLRHETATAADIYVTPLARGNPQRLTRDRARVLGMTWARDGRSIIFASEREGGEPHLWRVSASGGASERVVEVREPAAFPTVPAGGNGLAFMRWSRNTEMCRLRLSEVPSRPVRVEVDAQGFATPRFSPDATRVVFVRSHPKGNEILLTDPNGGAPAPVVPAGERMGSPRWSPDGQEIAFDAFVRGNWEIQVAGAKGGTPSGVTAHPAEDVRPSWSADGKWIYFGSDRSGTMQIWKAPRAGGEAKQVTRNGGNEAVESPDGRFVYYVRGGIAGLWSVPASGGDETLLIKDLQWENSRNWASPGAASTSSPPAKAPGPNGTTTSIYGDSTAKRQSASRIWGPPRFSTWVVR
jgi:Tol biopolymer transport system component/DNA-binding winged helix-turn-helix (wHTH) protein